eukprot:Selendium_serpulae@DN6421_c3_g1_i6.p1
MPTTDMPTTDMPTTDMPTTEMPTTDEPTTETPTPPRMTAWAQERRSSVRYCFPTPTQELRWVNGMELDDRGTGRGEFIFVVTLEGDCKSAVTETVGVAVMTVALPNLEIVGEFFEGVKADEVKLRITEDLSAPVVPDQTTIPKLGANGKYAFRFGSNDQKGTSELYVSMWVDVRDERPEPALRRLADCEALAWDDTDRCS